MSNQPPSDIPPPDGADPTAPLGGSPDAGRLAPRPPGSDPTAAPVSGQPWATASGDSLSAEPYRPPAAGQQPSGAPNPPPGGAPGPQPPTFQPGYASLPRPSDPDYPPTSQFPPVESYPATAPYPYPAAASDHVPPPSVGYAPPGYAPPGYAPDHGSPGHQAPGYPPPPGHHPGPGYPGPPGRPPRKSKLPIVAVIVAVTLLLCGGVATAGVLVARNVADRAEEAVDNLPTLDPQLPTVDPELPGLPTDLPGLPTELPQAPNGSGRTITVTYEVTGDGPASQILYTEKLGEAPKRLQNVKLPWKFTTEIETPALVSVVAMRIDTSDGTIGCRALVDGAEVKQRTSEPGTVATASCTHFALD